MPIAEFLMAPIKGSAKIPNIQKAGYTPEKFIGHGFLIRKGNPQDCHA